MEGGRALRIRYREAGGVTGIARGVEIDTASLPRDEARRVVALVEGAGLVGQEERGPEEARDLRGYELVVEVEASVIVVRFDDATTPPTADELLAYLQSQARPIPLKPPEDP